jgi:hypothetical protein
MPSPAGWTLRIARSYVAAASLTVRVTAAV